MKEIRHSIVELNKLLEACPDDAKYTKEFLTYLKMILKMRAATLPVVEIVTLIKEYKPLVFMEMKQLSSKNIMLQILIESTTDFDTAHNKIQNMKRLVEEEPV